MPFLLGFGDLSPQGCSVIEPMIARRYYSRRMPVEVVMGIAAICNVGDLGDAQALACSLGKRSPFVIHAKLVGFWVSIFRWSFTKSWD
jgi:hypothetical protein